MTGTLLSADDAAATNSSWLTNPEKMDTLIGRMADAAPETDDDGTFPERVFGWLADAGLLAVTLPGGELDDELPNTGGLLQLLKRIGTGNLAVGRVYEGHVNALNLISLYATVDQKRNWYDDVAQYHRLFSVWNTQASDGVRIHAVGNGRYVLEGSKTFCSGSGWIQRPLVTGELIGAERSGWQMCIIPTERVKAIPQDVRFWQPLGMRASVSYKLNFTGVELSTDDLLGQPGDYFRQPHFSGGAVRFAAVQLGGAEALFDATRALLVSMNRTDDGFQKTRLAEMGYLIESGNQWIDTAGRKVDAWRQRGNEADRIVAYANMTRTAIEEICLRVMQLAERSVGARGLMRPLPFERIHRDLTFYLRQPAPDATLVDIGQYVLKTKQTAMLSGVDKAHVLDEMARTIDPDELDTIGDVLVIAPHPDDESLGCGGTIALLRERGFSVHVLFVSDGTRSHPNSLAYPAERLRQLRESEALAALHVLNVAPEQATFMRQKDTEVATPDSSAFADAVAFVRQLLMAVEPTTVLVPWRRDPHRDHRASWQLLTGALAQLPVRPRVLEYLIWLWELGNEADMPGPDEMIAWRVPIASVMAQRSRAIAAHCSQVTRLIDDDPAAFYLSPELLTHFAPSRELFLEERTDPRQLPEDNSLTLGL